MIITFPHLGDAHIAARLFFKEIGVETIIPSLNSNKVLEEGAKYAPEEICLPFKLMVANLMECHKKGADTVVMPATLGPCRLGEYAELLKSILDANGYHFEWIVVDSPNDIGKRELFRRLGRIVSERKAGRHRLAAATGNAYRIIKGIEKLEKTTYRMAAYEMNRGEYKSVLQIAKKDLSRAENMKEGLRILKSAGEEMKQIPTDRKKAPLQIMLTGEIFSLIEPFASHNLEEKLMEAGVSFSKRMYIGWWLDKTVLNPFYLKYINKKKNKFLYCNIGGYAKETVEDGILCSKKRYDGIIQVFPAGCMPEIVSKSVFSRMADELDLKVLTLIFDEMDGEAGYITRLEAFVDMLQMQRNRMKRVKRVKEEQANVLFGN